MTSAIDATKPTSGSALTAHVRANFAAAKSEIEALQVGNTVVDAASDTTCWPMLARTQTGDQAPSTDAGLTYNASTNVLTTGEYIASGSAGAFETTNVNTDDSYMINVLGSMSLNTATLNAEIFATSITGGASLTTARGMLLNNSFAPTANPTIYNLANQFTLASGASPATVVGLRTLFTLGAAALGGTITDYYGYTSAFTANAAATTNITDWRSFYAGPITQGALQTITNVYGFNGVIASGTGRWNCYMDGTADNAFNGNCRFGAVTAPTVEVDVTGAILATTFIRSSGATSGIGYTTGAGGTVTQATSKATGVTLNKVAGNITMNNAALAADAIVSFTLTNSAIAAEDQLICTHHATGTFGAYVINGRCAAGSATITVTNISTGSLSEAIVIKFDLFKSVAA